MTDKSSSLVLLAKIIGSAWAAVSVHVAPVDRANPGVFHKFATDADRRAILRALLPKAQVDMATRESDLTITDS